MKKQQLIKGCIAAVLVCTAFLTMMGYAGYNKVEDTLNLMQTIDRAEVKKMTNPNIAEDTKEALDENWTVALFGIDSRDSSVLSTGNSDVIILASVNQKSGNIKLASVYRDTYLKTGDSKYRKANEAYAAGGPKKAVKMLNENLDLQIDDYVSINWSAVATAINILGGIDIDITDKEFRYINSYITETVNSTGIGSQHLKKAGFNHLDGVQAVAYSRLRYTDSDFKRTERQRLVMALMLEKAKKADWVTLNHVIETVLPMTASSIEAGDIIILGKNIFKYNFTGSTGFPFEHKEKLADGQDYVFPINLEKDVSKLHEFLYEEKDYVPSNAVLSIGDSISLKYNQSSNAKKTKIVKEELESLEEALTEPSTERSTESEGTLEMDLLTDIPSSEAEDKQVIVETLQEITESDFYGPGYETTEEQNEEEIETEPELESAIILNKEGDLN